MRRMWIVRREDFRPIDWNSGKRLALTAGEMKQCDCCGKKISKGDWTNTGHLIGSECSISIQLMNGQSEAHIQQWLKTYGITTKQLSFFNKYAVGN